MKTFKTHAAQGEISIKRIAKLPDGVRAVAPENGKFVIGHSETGHHHTMVADRVQVFEKTDAPAGMRILYAIIEGTALLEHERSFDTHEPIQHAPGIYEYRIGREFDPYAEIARRQAD